MPMREKFRYEIYYILDGDNVRETFLIKWHLEDRVMALIKKVNAITIIKLPLNHYGNSQPSNYVKSAS